MVGAAQSGRDGEVGKLTINEVAAAANVSPSAVSFALNGKGTLSQATRARILEVARDLGYAANPLARGLRGQSSRILAINLRSLDVGGMYQPAGVDHFSRLFSAAATTALDLGYGMVLIGREHADPDRSTPLWVDGYVIEDPLRDDPLLHRLLALKMPVVTVGWDPADKSAAPFVSTAERKDTTEMLDHLRERGARTIALISGSERTSWHLSGESAYRAWAKRHQSEVITARSPESAGVDGGRIAAAELLEKHPGIDAIFCHTARHAVGAMEAATAAGRDVPRDILIAAGSDSELAREARPAISTIDLQPEELGRRAVALLVHNITAERPQKRAHVDARILIRDSTAAGLAARDELRPSAAAMPDRA